MEKTSSMVIKVNSETKEKVVKFLSSLGIPFEIENTIAPQFSNEMLEALEEAKEMEKYPENYKKFHSVKELMEDLESEDE